MRLLLEVLVTGVIAGSMLIPTRHSDAQLALESSAADVSALPFATAVQQSAYVVGRYFCEAESDGSSRGTCDIETRAATCQEAFDAHRKDVQSRGDVCKRCTRGMTDNTRKYSGKFQWIHDGACR